MFIPTGSSVWYTIPVTRHSRIGGCVAAGNGRYFSDQAGGGMARLLYEGRVRRDIRGR